MKNPGIDRREVNTVADLEATLAEQLARDDLHQIQIGEGPGRVIVAGAQTRHCGDCSYCCTAAGINELEKPPMVRCYHLARRPARGCSIYHKEGFPSACGKF
jgi:hypothetical protein